MLLDRPRVVAVLGAASVGAAVAAAIARGDYAAQRDTLRRLPPLRDVAGALHDVRVLYAASIFGAAVAALCLCLVLAAARPRLQPFVVCLAPFVAFAAALPVYAYAYRDVAPGWHVGIAEGYRIGPMAGVVVSLFAYGAIRLVQRWRNRAPLA